MQFWNVRFPGELGQVPIKQGTHEGVAGRVRKG